MTNTGGDIVLITGNRSIASETIHISNKNDLLWFYENPFEQVEVVFWDNI